MAILEQIMQMKRQGIPDEGIIRELSQQGISLKQINDALKQAEIKNAVYSPEDNEEMQASIMPEEEIPTPLPNKTYTPRVYETQEQYASPQYTPVQEEYAPQQPQEQQYYAPGEGYEQYSASGVDTDSVMEIADQIFSEKIKKIQKQIDATSETTVLLQAKMENISERFKKIESIIDRLQIAILEKVGSYGKNLESIKKEMSMMQDSFSKMISPSKRTERREEEISEEAKEEEPLEKEGPKKKFPKKK